MSDESGCSCKPSVGSSALPIALDLVDLEAGSASTDYPIITALLKMSLGRSVGNEEKKAGRRRKTKVASVLPHPEI